MAIRVRGRERTREALHALMEGAAQVDGMKSGLVRMATRLIVEEGLEEEVADALGRGCCERGPTPGGGYRNGTREGGLKTAEGRIACAAPQVAGTPVPSRSALRARRKAAAKALRTWRPGCWRAGFRCAISRTPSGTGTGGCSCRARRFRRWATACGRTARLPRTGTWGSTGSTACSLTGLRSGCGLPGVAGRCWRPGGSRSRGKRSWLHMMAGSREDHGTVSAFFQDMRARGLGDPLLAVPDGAPGIIKATGTCFPRPARQRCLAHRMRNLAAKVPEDVRPEFKARAEASCEAPSRKIARELTDDVEADCGRGHPSAAACFRDDFKACIAPLRLPAGHRRATRTTNLLERLFVEERRRMKIIANAFGEKAVPGSCPPP